MDFDTDPATEFLKREREELGDLESEIILNSEVGAVSAEPLSGDEFEMINNDIEGGENDDLAGMEFRNAPAIHEVPEKIKKWQEEQKIMLEQKDVKEKEEELALRASAAKELSDWYHTYRDSKEKTRTMNRNSEKDLSTADTNGATTHEHIWESISHLCDFSAQAKAPKNGRDTTRMRTIFLQLKSSPPSKNI